MAKKITRAVCLKVSPQDHAVLETSAAMAGTTMAAVVRGLIRAYLEPSVRGRKVFQGWKAPLEHGGGEQIELDVGA